MSRVRRGALLTRLMDKMTEAGSWCGETHIQKAVYVAQEVVGLPTGYEFVLYKHGPFSFELRDELTALRADNVVGLAPRWHYGPGIITTQGANAIQKLYPKTLRRYAEKIEFVAKTIGAKDVREVEKLATALYVRKKGGGTMLSREEAACEITKLKPHISNQEAVNAVSEIDNVMEETRRTIGS